MATRGGAREGAGRRKGTPNKITAEIKAIAQKHGPKAIKTLVDLLDNAQSEQARVAAAKELLDRGYGKSTQHVEQQHEGEIVIQVLTNVPRPQEASVIDLEARAVEQPRAQPKRIARDHDGQYH